MQSIQSEEKRFIVQDQRKRKAQDCFSGGTIFVDVATSFTRCHFQASLGAEATPLSKNAFEREGLTHGIVVWNCSLDNGTFSKSEFMKEILEKNENIAFSGVGAHHQNGCAEVAICAVVTKARLMSLHAQLQWQEQAPADVWPMAMQHALHLINIIPK